MTRLWDEVELESTRKLKRERTQDLHGLEEASEACDKICFKNTRKGDVGMATVARSKSEGVARCSPNITRIGHE